MSDNSSSSSSSASSGFCPDPLWDPLRTWVTDDPDFTRCFHETVLVYLPAILLLIIGPFQVAAETVVYYPLLLNRLFCLVLLGSTQSRWPGSLERRRRRQSGPQLPPHPAARH